MSNHLAIATVTAALQRLLQAGIQRDMDGARVTTLRPGTGGGLPEMGVNLYLYQVLSNPALQNADTTPFRTKGMALRRQAALDIYYLFSFYGNEGDLEPQRLLGSVVRTLNDFPTLSPELIQDTIGDSTLAYLAQSDLAEQLQAVKLMPLDLGLEDLSKIWSIFFQTPHALSIAYKASAVVIEGLDASERALPIRQRYPQVVSPYGGAPTLERVLAIQGPQVPITAASTLRILGDRLKAPHVWVRIGSWEGVPEVVGDRELHLSLTALGDALQAGVQTLQVVHTNTVTAPRLGQRTPGRTHGIESNGLPLMVRPQVRDLALALGAEMGEEGRSGTVRITTDVALGLRQRCLLTLNPWSVTPGRAYGFAGQVREDGGHQVEFPLEGVPPGEYLVRIQVDGAESLLETDDDADSPTAGWYITPRLTVPS